MRGELRARVSEQALASLAEPAQREQEIRDPASDPAVAPFADCLVVGARVADRDVPSWRRDALETVHAEAEAESD